MNELALFSGAGGGILGGHLLGWRTVCAVEVEPYARDVLVARQDDGALPPFPVWDDVSTFDGRPWRGRVGVVSGGFPCQDISAAGKGAGIDGERSGLWGHMARVIRDVRPRFVFVENSPMLASRGLGRVLGDLAELGYDAEWCVLGADDCGAPHRRKRIWIVAHANLDGRHAATARASARGGARIVSDPDLGRCEVDASRGLLDGERAALGDDADGRGRGDGGDSAAGQLSHADQDRRELPDPQGHGRESGRESARGRGLAEVRRVDWPTEPNVGRVAHGVAARVDRLRAIGNGQVPRVAATAFELLRARGGWHT